MKFKIAEKRTSGSGGKVIVRIFALFQMETMLDLLKEKQGINMKQEIL